MVYTIFGQHAVAYNVAIITSINETAIEWACTFNSIAIIPFSDTETRHTMDMIIRPINDPSMYITSVFLIRKDRELFLKEIGVLK